MIDDSSLNANEFFVSKLKSGEISSVDLQDLYKRIEKFDKDVKAWAFLDKRSFLEKAQEADEYRKSGKPLGALHAASVAIKDIIGTYDIPTECGTVFRKMSSTQDSEIVNLLKTAGAIIMGKTVTCELAYIHPSSKPKNPHDYSRDLQVVLQVDLQL